MNESTQNIVLCIVYVHATSTRVSTLKKPRVLGIAAELRHPNPCKNGLPRLRKIEKCEKDAFPSRHWAIAPKGVTDVAPRGKVDSYIEYNA